MSVIIEIKTFAALGTGVIGSGWVARALAHGVLVQTAGRIFTVKIRLPRISRLATNPSCSLSALRNASEPWGIVLM